MINRHADGDRGSLATSDCTAINPFYKQQRP
jgi:hypothetical protein